MATPDIAEVLEHFGVASPAGALEPVAEGYINDTYRVTIPGRAGFILQRINTGVFPDPGSLMHNLEQVLPLLGGPGYRQLELVPTRDGKTWTKDPVTGAWRLFRFLPGSRTFSRADQPGIAREAGRILGRFHQLLEDADPGALATVLPGFHDPELRMQQLEQAAQDGVAGRIREGQEPLGQARQLYSYIQKVPIRDAPVRVCHNDPKLSNILFDQETHRALCLIDLDTLMPGYLVYDFGDAARSVVNPLPEDHAHPSEITLDLAAFSEFCSGFLSNPLRLDPAEREHLPFGLVLMPLLHGIRALADHFSGDLYYKTTFEGQNLVRARNLLALSGQARDRMSDLRESWSKA